MKSTENDPLAFFEDFFQDGHLANEIKMFLPDKDSSECPSYVIDVNQVEKSYTVHFTDQDYDREDESSDCAFVVFENKYYFKDYLDKKLKKQVSASLKKINLILFNSTSLEQAKLRTILFVDRLKILMSFCESSTEFNTYNTCYNTLSTLLENILIQYDALLSPSATIAKVRKIISKDQRTLVQKFELNLKIAGVLDKFSLPDTALFTNAVNNERNIKRLIYNELGKIDRLEFECQVKCAHFVISKIHRYCKFTYQALEDCGKIYIKNKPYKCKHTSAYSSEFQTKPRYYHIVKELEKIFKEHEVT